MQIIQNRPNLSPAEAAAYLGDRYGISAAPATLSKWRCIGGGPAFLKFGQRRVLYPIAELDRWAAERLGQPRRVTAEAL